MLNDSVFNSRLNDLAPKFDCSLDYSLFQDKLNRNGCKQSNDNIMQFRKKFNPRSKGNPILLAPHQELTTEGQTEMNAEADLYSDKLPENDELNVQENEPDLSFND